MTKNKKITKKQYERAKQIVSEYEAQFSTSFVKGDFKASDLEYNIHSVSVPKIKDGMLTDDEMLELQGNLNSLNVPWFDLGIDDMGYLVITARHATDYSQYENEILEALNSL